MNGGNRLSQLAVEKLVCENYNYWKLCMEAYLQGQDLWDLVFGADVVIPKDTPQNVDLCQKWKMKCRKAPFALRTSINREYIQHVRDMSSPKEVWETLENSSLKRTECGCSIWRMNLLEWFKVICGSQSIF